MSDQVEQKQNEVTKTVEQQNKGERKPRNNNYQRRNNKKQRNDNYKPRRNNQDSQNVKKEKKGLKEPENWREEILATLTGNSKIPEYPTDEELIKRPSYDNFRRKLDSIQKTIQEIQLKIKNKKEDLRNAREEAINKNIPIYESLKKLREEKRALNDQLNINKEKKNQIYNKVQELENEK